MFICDIKSCIFSESFTFNRWVKFKKTNLMKIDIFSLKVLNNSKVLQDASFIN